MQAIPMHPYVSLALRVISALEFSICFWNDWWLVPPLAASNTEIVIEKFFLGLTMNFKEMQNNKYLKENDQ